MLFRHPAEPPALPGPRPSTRSDLVVAKVRLRHELEAADAAIQRAMRHADQIFIAPKAPKR
jgi:hypothetical protein